MTPEETMARAEAARRLLDDPMLQDAFKTLEAECIDQWKKAPARDHEGREWIWMLLQATQRLEGLFRGYIESGRLASENLKIAEQHKRFAERNYIEDENA